MDCVPGHSNGTTFFIKRHGEFHGMCSEICGVLHGFIPIDHEVVLQIERISSDLAYIRNQVDAKWAEHGFEFKCEYLNETIVYPLADIQSWNIGWVEPENEALINPDKCSNEDDMVVVILCISMIALGVGAVYYSY